MTSTKHVRTPGVLLGDRIDPWYYKPVFLAVDDALLRLRQRGHPSVRLDTIATVEYGFMPLEDYWSPDTGAPFLRVTNIVDHLHIDMSDVKYVNPQASSDSGYRLECGDVIVVQCGNSTGRIAYVSERFNDWVFPSFALRVRLMEKGWDSAYLAAFLSVSLGQLQIQRTISITSVRPNTTKPAIESICVLDLDSAAQAYIGDKVRQAERLRERARALESEIQQLSTTEEIDAALRLPESRTNRLNAGDLGYRLDSKHYGLRATAVFKACGKNGVTIQDFEPDVSNGFEYREFCESGTPYVTVGDVSSGRLNLDSAPRIPFSVDVPEKARLDVTCVLVVRSGSIGAAAKVDAEDTEACISSHLIRFRFKDEESAAVVTCFLNSPAGTVIQEKIVYGGVQPQISQSELLEVPVPREIVQRGTQLLNLLNSREKAIRMAQRLTAAAKLLVEALIDGKVTEAELKDAHGNRDADRAILLRLTRNGIDEPNEPPLFPNLDDLYEALDESADAAVTVEARG